MAQPETAAGEVGNPADSNPADAFNAIAEEMLAETPQDEEEAPLDNTDPEGELDETDIEEEADDLPPIDAPVSWDAEAKEAFAKLPRPLQETVQKRETERERFVQQKSQEATQAKQSAIQQATSELAQIEQGYAQQLQTLAQQIMPQAPDPAMLQYDPQGFYAQRAQYEAKVAQQQQLQQQASEYTQQAQLRAQHIAQAEAAEQHRTIVEKFPEYADPTTGPKLQAELTAVAKELGYSDELIAQARASDILAMKTAADWKAKAQRLDALMSKKMEKVRAAKGLPKVATPGVAQGSDQVRARSAQAAFEVAKSSKNRDVAGAGFYDYLKNSGQIK